MLQSQRPQQNYQHQQNNIQSQQQVSSEIGIQSNQQKWQIIINQSPQTKKLRFYQSGQNQMVEESNESNHKKYTLLDQYLKKSKIENVQGGVTANKYNYRFDQYRQNGGLTVAKQHILIQTRNNKVGENMSVNKPKSINSEFLSFYHNQQKNEIKQAINNQFERKSVDAEVDNFMKNLRERKKKFNSYLHQPNTKLNDFIQSDITNVKTTDTRNYNNEQMQNSYGLSRISGIKYETDKIKQNTQNKIQDYEQWQMTDEPQIMEINSSPAQSISKKYLSSQIKQQYLNVKAQNQDKLQDLIVDSRQIRKKQIKIVEKDKINKKQSNFFTGNRFLDQSQKKEKEYSIKKQLILNQNRDKVNDLEINLETLNNPSIRSSLNKTNSKTVQNCKSKSHLNKQSKNYSNFLQKFINNKIVSDNSLPKTNQKLIQAKNSQIYKQTHNYSAANHSSINKKHSTLAHIKNAQNAPKKPSSIFNQICKKPQIKNWYQHNIKQIQCQTQKIKKNEMIRKSITDPQINQRLINYVKGMISPTQWLLSMSDQVYGSKNKHIIN